MHNGNLNGNGAGTLAGRVALVTGASRGIGRAIALDLAHRGADVAINYLSSMSEAEGIAREVCEMGRRTMIVQGHVGDAAEARNIIKRVFDEWGRLDILVNNAGITRDRSVRKLTDEDWEDVLQTNLSGTYYCTSAAIPIMVEQKYGRIINVSSFTALAGNFGQANYAATKGGIIAFTKVLALELAKFNITANCLAPGFTMTDMLSAVPTHIQDQIKARIPMGRFATPEEVAKAAGFLAGDADYITGHTISINGGLYLQ